MNGPQDWLGPWLASLVVEHFEREGHLDERMAAQAVTALAGRPIPREFAWLLAKHLAGNLPTRRGRRRDAQAFSKIRLMRREFARRREAGESYDAAISTLVEWSGAPRATVEAWINNRK